MDTFTKVRDILTADERRRSLMLFGMMLLMGLLEVMGVASIMPFVAVVANPGVVETNTYLKTLYDYLGYTDTNSFLIFLGAAIFVVVVGSLSFKCLTFWVMSRFGHSLKYSIGSRLLRGYLDRPYSFFLNRHSADLGKTVLSEVNQVVNNSLLPAMEMVASAIVAMLLIVFVVMVNPVVALCAVLLFGGAYVLIYTSLRKYLTRIGAARVKANQERFRTAQEALGGIKDVKVLGLEEGYMESFKRPARRFARVSANSQIIGQIPQFALQALVFGSILILLMYLMSARNGDLGAVLPLIAVYVMAGSRLNPALKKIYQTATSIRFSKPALDLLYGDYAETCLTNDEPASSNSGGDSKPILLESELRFDGLCYTYPQAERPALNDLSLSIAAKTTVGLVGSTGAGKTTIVDIVLGLLTPQKGVMKVDGVVINNENVGAWQKSIGYVPQHIFLTDDTVAANIAFGAPHKSIDQEAVERAARVAEIHSFVMEEMPDGYDTLVGERGVRLSGGQRQRIGIARALYRDPDILVLDEATSALDNLTERSVMDAVHNLSHRKTIIIVAHRLTTIRECDVIFMLEHGRLIGTGSYDELLNTNRDFGAMAAQYS